MKQPVSSVFSEFFVNNLFELSSYACKCEKDTKNVVPGEPPETTLKMYSLIDHPVHFVYAEKDGLNLTGNQGRVLLKNILGQVLALKEDNADDYIRLINKIGFLLPVSSENYEAVDLKSLTEIVKRIKATISLMNAIDGKTVYEEIRMFNAMTFLLFREPVELDLEEGTYKTCPHTFYSVMHNTIPPRDFRGDYDGLLDNGNFEVNDTVSSTGKAEVSRDLFNQLQMGDFGTVPGQGSREYRNLFFAYTSAIKDQSDWGYIVDFYMNYQNYAGIIDKVDLEKITYYGSGTTFSLNDELRAALPKVARMVLSNEINHNISKIHMQYDGEALAPKWQLDNLLQALYFAIFYMKPGVKMYKRCANPNCKRDVFFLTDRTKTNKEYCCTQCRSAAGQRRRRLAEQAEKEAQP